MAKHFAFWMCARVCPCIGRSFVFCFFVRIFFSILERVPSIGCCFKFFQGDQLYQEWLQVIFPTFSRSLFLFCFFVRTRFCNTFFCHTLNILQASSLGGAATQHHIVLKGRLSSKRGFKPNSNLCHLSPSLFPRFAAPLFEAPCRNSGQKRKNKKEKKRKKQPSSLQALLWLAIVLIRCTVLISPLFSPPTPRPTDRTLQPKKTNPLHSR